MSFINIPACPFSQRVEILLELKGLRDRVRFEVVDVTKPRADWLLAKTRGTTALPVLETEQGQIIKESLIIMRYFDDRFPEKQVQRTDPYERAVEAMMTLMEGDLTGAGYRFVLNQDPESATRSATRCSRNMLAWTHSSGTMRQSAPSSSTGSAMPKRSSPLSSCGSGSSNIMRISRSTIRR